nr:ABC transporter ATP-binding protein [Paenibacillus cellulosilyticus]
MSLLLLANIVIQIIQPQITRFIIDSALSNQSFRSIITAAMLFLLIVLFNLLINVVIGTLAETIGWSTTNDMRVSLFRICLGQDMVYQQKRTPGEMIERLDGDVSTLARFFSNLSIQFIGNALLLIGILSMIFIENWLVGLCFTCFTVVLFAIFRKLRSISSLHWFNYIQSSANFSGFIGEAVAAKENVTGNASLKYIIIKYTLLTRNLIRNQMKAMLMANGMWMSNILFTGLGTALMFFLSLFLWRQGATTVGGIYLLIHYQQMLMNPINTLRSQIEELQQVDASFARLSSLIIPSASIVDGNRKLPAGALDVKFDQVDFAYNDEKMVLNHISFHLRAGETLCVLGRTGSGKSTLSKLLLRLYDPLKGNIFINDLDIGLYQIDSIRSRIGYFNQDIKLFNASLRDNITLYDPSITDDQLLTIIDQLQLDSWFRSLPHGFDTIISQNAGLSAGEEQLIALARMFLRDPGMIVLDEATSRLDDATEYGLQNILKGLINKRTAIIVSHKLSSIRLAKYVAIIDNHTIVEYGEREILENDNKSLLYEFIHSQEGVTLQ